MASVTEPKKATSPKDLILILLYAKGHTGKLCEPVSGRTRLMKMVFLFEKEVMRKLRGGETISSEALPDFTPYSFGPFSSQVFADLEFLVDLGFVRRFESEKGSEVLPEETYEYAYWQAGADPITEEREGLRAEERFSLTEIGREFVEQGEAGELTPEQWVLIGEFKARCTKTPLRALLKYLYTKYPKWATKSKIRDEVLSEY